MEERSPHYSPAACGALILVVRRLLRALGSDAACPPAPLTVTGRSPAKAPVDSRYREPAQLSGNGTINRMFATHTTLGEPPWPKKRRTPHTAIISRPQSITSTQSGIIRKRQAIMHRAIMKLRLIMRTPLTPIRFMQPTIREKPQRLMQRTAKKRPDRPKSPGTRRFLQAPQRRLET